MGKKVTTNARVNEPGTYFSPELFTDICSRIADGESLNKICTAADMPSRKTFFQWVAKSDELRKEYQLAIDMRTEYYAEEIIEISDDTSDDELFIETSDASGASAKRVCNNEFVQRSKLRVDARKWYVSKLNPKKYGDKITQEVTGDGGGPVVVKIEI